MFTFIYVCFNKLTLSYFLKHHYSKEILVEEPVSCLTLYTDLLCAFIYLFYFVYFLQLIQYGDWLWAGRSGSKSQHQQILSFVTETTKILVVIFLRRKPDET